MRWLINQDLSCCEVDDRLVFLDFALDRYFRLSSPLESVMRRFLATGVMPRQHGRELEDKGIVIARASCRQSGMPDLPDPTASAIESSLAMHRPPGPGVLVEVATTLWWTRHRLRRQPFKAVIEDSVAHRKTRVLPRASPAEVIDAVREAAMQFICARRYVPIEPCCLLDSLALLRFLSRRRLPARIVFGVTLAPFAAHCWLQADGVVLNETLSDACAHTPIRII